ncbi:MAG: HAMP domain-containing sensor histidine kinase [Syntrophobacteraceae bacterium]|nr:HAMP domain-containing sensor histidine kinase [Syntrophobacteraceae bacterium]
MVEEASCELFRQGGSVSSGEMTYCISQRVQEKKGSYERYGFERSQEEAFATFFDLAQEYTTIDSLYQICSSVAKEFLDLESRIYIIEPKSSQLELVCTSEEGLVGPGGRATHRAVVVDAPTESDASWLFPIRGNQALVNTLPFLGQRSILGVFEVFPKDRIDERKHFFLEKFTNRIGYNLHQKLLVQQNINHIKFINQLVSDIEHNVITPNMYYKLFLIRLRKMVENYRAIEEPVQKAASGLTGAIAKSLAGAAQRLHEANQSLQNELSALCSHYEHNSLFLETLMRKDHFQKGAYVLRKQSCNFQKEIIRPLIDRYYAHFQRKSITVDDRIEKGPDEPVTLFVDKGLISQVFDNFFSNALKYAGQTREDGGPARVFSLNRQIVRRAFAQDKPGVRFEFFTSGAPLSREECERVFDEGFRAGGNAEEGKGHGLYFVKNVVEIHGGLVGCEPQPGGNLFYLVLPLEKQ